MGMEEDDPVEQAAAARRERLRALRAAKELLSTPDDGAAAAGPTPASTEAEGGSGGDREDVAGVEDSATQAAVSRRDRLKVLRTAKELLSTPDEDSVQSETKEGSEDAEEERKLNVKFRNYLPHDKQLQEHKLAPPVLPKFEDPIAATPIPEKVEDPFLNIAPKKPNWDLRRDVQKKLDKLERRTVKALYQLYAEQEKQNLASEEMHIPHED